VDYLNDGDPATSDDLGVTVPVADDPSPNRPLTTVLRRGRLPDRRDGLRHHQDFKDLYGRRTRARHGRDRRPGDGITTSVEHPWFEAALAGDPDYADWYQWSATDPGTRTSWARPAWHQAPDGRYY
jgi:hypothetical protein